MVELHRINENEQAELREVAERYWMELMPNGPVEQDLVCRAHY